MYLTPVSDARGRQCFSTSSSVLTISLCSAGMLCSSLQILFSWKVSPTTTFPGRSDPSSSLSVSRQPLCDSTAKGATAEVIAPAGVGAPNGLAINVRSSASNLLKRLAVS